MAYAAFTPADTMSRRIRTRQRGGFTAQRLDDLIFRYNVLTFCLFCVRDGFTAVLRYFLDIIHLGVLWFVPDLMAFVSLAAFVLTACVRDKNTFAIIMVGGFVVSIFTSIAFFSGDAVVVFSGIKMFLPMIVGFGFRDRSFFEWRFAKLLMWAILIVSVVGVLVNPYYQYPWTGFASTNAFGVEKTAQTLWWSGGITRFGGFAGDSTMAAFMILSSYIMLSRQMNIVLNVLCWPLSLWAIYITTSKTALGLFSLYILVYLFLWVLPKGKDLRMIRLFAALSFICILVPPLLMVTLGGTDLSTFSRSLASLTDRINNTWGGPFLIISDIFPVGLFTGCGLGCYSYPMKYSDLFVYYLPLDNFYLTTILEMGYPFIIFVVLLLFRTLRMQDTIKLLLLMNWNIYTVTIQGYGPSYATLLYGYAVSEVFSAIKRRREYRLPIGSRQVAEPASIKPNSVAGRPRGRY